MKYLFDDTLNGVVAGSNTLNRTSNGGMDWVTQYEGHIRSVSMLDSLNYYVIANNYPTKSAIILKTTNAGSTFTSQSFDNSFLERVAFIDKNIAIAVGDTGLIMKTTNGGSSWFKQTSGINYHLRYVSFTDSLNGIASGYNYNSNPIYSFIITTDGGNTWISKCQSVTSYNLSDVSFADEYIGVAVGDSGTIIRTTNAGITWSSQTSGTNSNIIQVDMTKGKGFAYTSTGLLLRTTDKGISWTQQINGTNVRRVSFYNDSIGMAISNGLILKTTNGGRNWYIKIITTYGLSDLAFIDENNIVVIGNSSNQNPVVIMKTTNGGTTWTSQYIGGEYNTATGICFADSLTGFIVGSSYDPTEYFSHAFIWKTSDAGITWFGSYGFSHGTLSKVHFYNKDIGIATGSRLLKTTNGGTTWEFGFTGSLRKAFFITPDRAIVVGGQGLILTNNISPVPVELSSFTASTNKNSVVLNWITATEINNKGFEVQRQKENLDFEVLAFVEGYGNSTENKYYSYVDDNVKSGINIYRLKQIDYDGSYKYSSELEIEFNTILEFSLSQNYPNPFNPSTKINYTIAKEGRASLIIYDVLGREVKKLFDEEKSKGNYSIEFNASELSSGIYFYRLSSNSFSEIKKMIMIK